MGKLDPRDEGKIFVSPATGLVRKDMAEVLNEKNKPESVMEIDMLLE